MFTGIVESLGTIKKITKEADNLHIVVEADFTNEIKIDQSVAHNGICLTVVDITDKTYTVTAIKETILKTNIADWQENDEVNLERAMKLGDRLDGHIVQGHVDQTAVCTNIENANGSTYFTFKFEYQGNLTIEKGSITVNGTSLTVVNSKIDEFSVAIIPYTFENTIFKNTKLNDKVNLEFDILGKYITKLEQHKKGI
ncbi:riboflavin synthase [Flavobacterium agricola]|uniref:Riboflavin synthase n=1 Tax=Flavobacterium agricola TaxID=2870839 RepID=A0ABY6LXX3_9FLAO|nr:riboflavin synthase [Flavobacterium agricola]UYW01188.1 riboflavin synthase [Flavobacterium agricola]